MSSLAQRRILLLEGHKKLVPPDSFDIPGVPQYIEAIVNRNMEGSNLIDLRFDRNVVSPGGNPELGFTIELTHNLTTYVTLDPAHYVGAIADGRFVRIALTGDRNIIQGGHSLRVSYDDDVGDIKNAVSADDLPDITPNTATSNSSTMNLLAGFAQWWDYNEASGATRAAKLGPSSHNMSDINTVNAVAGVDGGNAAHFSGSDFLLIPGSGTILNIPADGKFSGMFWLNVQAYSGSQTGYLLNKWSGLGVNRAMYTAILSNNKIQVGGEDASDLLFAANADNRGALDTGAWYGIGYVFDPDNDDHEVILYTQKDGEDDFTVDDEVVGSSTLRHAKQSTASAWGFGRLNDRPDITGTNAYGDIPHLWNLSLTEAEMAYLLKAPFTYPFYVDHL